MGSTYTSHVKGLRSVVRAAIVLLAVALLSTSSRGLAEQSRLERRVDDYTGSFSPSGKTIVFERFFSTQRRGVDTHPSFWRGRPGTSGAYFVMNADGTGLRRISRGQRFDWGCPSWFPDGKLVFARDYNLSVASVDGTKIERITDDRDGTLYRPSVSPGGRWIACDGFASRYGYGIIVMRADGTAMRRITTAANEIENDAGASWSPDGGRIAFSGYRGRFTGAGVYIVNRDGTGLRRLSNVAR